MNRETHSFIIRIWNEATDHSEDNISWRGSIDSVGYGTRLYFYDLDGVVQFIQEQSGISAKSKIMQHQSIASRIRYEINRVRKRLQL